MLIKPELLQLDLENIRFLRSDTDDWQRPLVLSALAPITRDDVEMYNFDSPAREGIDFNLKKSSLVVGVGAAALVTALPIGAIHAQEQDPPGPVKLMPSIVITGDSLTVGSVEAGNLKETFQAVGVDVTGLDYKGSRPLVWDGCDDEEIDRICQEISDGIRGLDRMQGPLAIADVAVIALGTNTPLERFEADFERNVRHAHTLSNTDGKPAVIAAPEMFYTKDSYTGSAQQKNDILHRMSERLAPEGIQLVVLPFAEAGIPLSDGIHPQWDRYDDLAQLTVQHVAPIAHERNLRNISVPLHLAETPIDIADINIQDLNLPTTVQPFGSSETQVIDNPVEGFIGRAIEIPQIIFGKTPEQDLGPKININSLQIDMTLADFTAEDARDVALNEALKLHDAHQHKASGGGSLVDRFKADINDVLPVDPFFVNQELTNSRINLSDLSTNTDIASRILNNTSSVPEIKNVSATAEPITLTAPTIETIPDPNGLRSLFSVSPEGVLEYSKLLSWVNNNFGKAAPSDIFPEGDFVLYPESIPGLNYTNSAGTTANERFISPKGAVALIVLTFKANELGEVPDIMDRASRHGEHRHGYDFDFGLLSTQEARNEFSIYAASLLETDGSAFFHHIVTGERDVEQLVDDFVASRGQEDPNMLLQTDHGQVPGDFAHLHFSLDGGRSGPFGGPEANVRLNDDRPLAPLLGSDYLGQMPVTDSPIIPVLENELPIDTRINNLGRINIKELDINWGNLISSDTQTNTEIEVPEPIDNVINIEDLIGQNPDIDNTEETSSVIELPDNYTDEGLVVENEEEVVPPVTTAPPVEVTAIPVVPANPYGTDAPLLDVFLPEVVQLVLPEAEHNNILNYTPIIMRALNEFSLADLQMACYALATINPETSTMAPIEEIGRGDGKEYGYWYGRGFIQLTWQSNYEAAGAALGIDLINYPELALDPVNSARIMGWFLKNREGDIRDALNNGDMRRARQIVNGEAAHGLDKFRDSFITCDNIT